MTRSTKVAPHKGAALRRQEQELINRIFHERLRYTGACFVATNGDRFKTDDVLRLVRARRVYLDQHVEEGEVFVTRPMVRAP